MKDRCTNLKIFSNFQLFPLREIVRLHQLCISSQTEEQPCVELPATLYSEGVLSSVSSFRKAYCSQVDFALIFEDLVQIS